MKTLSVEEQIERLENELRNLHWTCKTAWYLPEKVALERKIRELRNGQA